MQKLLHVMQTTPSLKSEDQSLCIGLLACPLSIALDNDESFLLKAQPADTGHDMEVCLSRVCVIEMCSEW